MANNNVVVEEEVLDTPDVSVGPSSDPIEAVEVTLSFNEYTQEISEDLVVTTYGDGMIVDQSGPFDNAENAAAFGTSFLDALTNGDIKPNPASLKG
jgi:hypothetical protein